MKTEDLFATRWRELAKVFLKLGATSFGGPAIIGIIQAELQEKVKKRRAKLESELQPLWDDIARVRGIGELLLSAETIAALDKFHAARTQTFEAYFEELDATSGAAKTAHTELVASAKKDLEL